MAQGPSLCLCGYEVQADCKRARRGPWLRFVAAKHCRSIWRALKSRGRARWQWRGWRGSKGRPPIVFRAEVQGERGSSGRLAGREARDVTQRSVWAWVWYGKRYQAKIQNQVDPSFLGVTQPKTLPASRGGAMQCCRPCTLDNCHGPGETLAAAAPPRRHCRPSRAPGRGGAAHVTWQGATLTPCRAMLGRGPLSMMIQRFPRAIDP